jgi:hypothetical protein
VLLPPPTPVPDRLSSLYLPVVRPLEPAIFVTAPILESNHSVEKRLNGFSLPHAVLHVRPVSLVYPRFCQITTYIFICVGCLIWTCSEYKTKHDLPSTFTIPARFPIHGF